MVIIYILDYIVGIVIILHYYILRKPGMDNPVYGECWSDLGCCS